MSRTKSNTRLERELAKRRNLEYELHHKKRELRQTNNRIKKMSGQSEILVTNHAIMRYFERVLKVDIEAIKKEILSDKVLKLYSELGNGKFPNDTFHVVIVNGVVKTVI